MLEGLREDLGIPANDEDLETGFGYGSTRKFDVVRQLEYLDSLPPGAEPGAFTSGEYSARSGGAPSSGRARPGSVSMSAGAAAGLTPRAAGGETSVTSMSYSQQQSGRRQTSGVGVGFGAGASRSAAQLPAPVANPEQHAAPPVDIKALLGLKPANKPEEVSSAAEQTPTSMSLKLKQQTPESIASAAPAPAIVSASMVSSPFAQPPPSNAAAISSTSASAAVSTTAPNGVASASMQGDSRRSSGLSAAGQLSRAVSTIDQSTYPTNSVGLFGQELHSMQLDNMVTSAPQPAMNANAATNGSVPKALSPTAESKKASNGVGVQQSQPQQMPDPLGTGTLNNSLVDELTRTIAQTLRVQEDSADAASIQSGSLEFSLSSTGGGDGTLGSTNRTAAAAGSNARSRRRQNRLETTLGTGTIGSPTAAGVNLVKQPTPIDSPMRSPLDTNKFTLSDDERGATAGKSVKFAQRPEILAFAPQSASASGSVSGSLEDAAFTNGGGGAPTLSGMLASFERRAVPGASAAGLEREQSRTSASDMEALDSRQSFTIPSGQDTYHTQQPQPASAVGSGVGSNVHRRGSRDGSAQQSHPNATPPPLTKQAVPKNASAKQDEDDTYAEDFEDEDTLK